MKPNYKIESCFEIFLLVLSIVAFAYILSFNFESVKAEETDSQYNTEQTLSSTQIAESYNLRCCIKEKSGAVCQDINNESECETNLQPTACAFVDACKKGCCYDTKNGICSLSSTQYKCSEDSGLWDENKDCKINECEKACCVVNSETFFITQRACRNYPNSIFLPQVNDELECLILNQIQTKGACVIQKNQENTCKFITKQECMGLKGEFHEDLLCTNPDLETNCKKTKQTICVDGKDEVYFKDSCGNVANIYDSSKIDNEEYWNVVSNSTCGEAGNINNDKCGACSRFLGSKCGKGNAEYGNYNCNDLNCNNAPSVVDALGNILKTKDRKNGESWCVYDSQIGDGKNVVGSRHYKYYCLNGEVKSEACADYKQEICSEYTDNETNIANAVCSVNNWRECVNYNSLATKKGKNIDYSPVKAKCLNNSQCYLKNLNFGKGYNFFECLPNYPSGFDIESGKEKTVNTKLCSTANFDCVKVQVKEMFGGWKCVSGCDCTSKKYVQQMNDFCSSLGDCGGSVNIAGKIIKSYSVNKKAYEINLSQYLKNIIPDETKIYPRNYSEIFKNLVGGKTGDNSSLIGDASEAGQIHSLISGVSTGFSGISFLLKPASSLKGIVPSLAYGDVGIPVTPEPVFNGIYAYIPPEAAVPTIGSTPPGVAAGGFQAPPPTVLEGVGNFLGGASSGSIAGMLVVKMFGLQGQAAMVVVVSAALAGGLSMVWSVGGGQTLGGAIATSLAKSLGIQLTQGSSFGVIGAVVSAAYGVIVGEVALGTALTTIFNELLISLLGGGPIGLVVGVVVAIIMMVFMGGETKETHVIFKCMPYQAPVGGADCEKINNIENKDVSKYKCDSLGQGCELLNEGTGNEKCFWNNRDDSNSPIITHSENITEGYKYENIDDGVFIKKENNECIPEFTPVVFGIETNELAQCKYDVQDLDFEEMNQYFIEDNSYEKEHVSLFMMPSISSLALEFNISQENITSVIGNLTYFVKCQDKNGNENSDSYQIKTCLNNGPDKTPPVIYTAIPFSNSYVPYNATEQDIVLMINEPATCKYSSEDKIYREMENNLSCSESLLSTSEYGYSCNATLSLENLSFYFRCKDQPLLQGENESQRNVNNKSYEYNLKRTSSELLISSLEPTNSIKSSTQPVQIELVAETSGGAENGKALCSWEYNGVSQYFYDTNFIIHRQREFNIFVGENNINVICQDIAGNIANKSLKINLELDSQAPLITRIFSYGGNLRIFTNENSECAFSNTNCGFIFENSSRMTGNEIEHVTSYSEGKIYYIKCRDIYNNKPAGCSVIIRPDNN